MNTRTRYRNLSILAALLIFILVLLPMNVYAEHADDSAQIVKVGFLTESPYMMECDEDGSNKSGYAYEYIQTIADYNGWEYEYIIGDWVPLMDMFVKGELDMMVDVSHTEEREKQMLFPDLPMGNEIYRLYSYYENTKINSQNARESLEGTKIGVRAATLEKEMLQDWVEARNISCEIVEYKETSELYKDFEDGFLAALVELEYFVQENWEPLAEIGSSDSYVAIRKGREDLLAELNDAQNLIKEIDPLYSYNLHDKYYTQAVVTKSLSEEEQKWVDSHDKIVCGLVNGTVFYYKDRRGNLKSILPEILNQILHEVGQDDIPVEYVYFDAAGDMEEALHNGDIDMGFPFYRNDYVEETKGYSAVVDIKNIPCAAITQAGTNVYDARVLAITKNSICIDYAAVHFPDADILLCEDWEEAIENVERGISQASISSVQLAEQIFLGNGNTRGLEAVELPGAITASLAVKKGNAPLYMLLKRGLTLTDSDFIENTLAGYNVVLPSYTYVDMLEDYWWLAVLSIVIILSLVFVLIFVSMRKKKDIQMSKERSRYIHIIQGLSSEYFSVYHVNMSLNYAYCYRVADSTQRQINIKTGDVVLYRETINGYINSEVIPEDRENMKNFLKEENIHEMLHKKTIVSMLYRIFRDGQKHYYQVSVAGVTGVNCENEFILGFSDVDEEVRNEEEQRNRLRDAYNRAEAANKAKSIFLSNMSHDIRTPMNAVIGYTSLATSHVDDKEKVLDYLSKVQISSGHLLNLINDVLDMSRIEAGKFSIKESEIDLSELLDDLMGMVQAEADSKNLQLIARSHVTVKEVVFDRLRLNQILINILGNAIKFTNPGGKVEFTLSQTSEVRDGFADYEFRVKDTGIGMSKDFLEHVFEPFERESNSTVSGIQGTGLGMSITKNIVDLLGGSISAESQQGVGTEFTVAFKIKVKDNANAEPEAAVPGMDKGIDDVPENKLKGLKVLIVEDNMINREILEEILKDQGIITESVCDGDEAVEVMSKAHKGQFDFILMDIQMPRMNGYEASKLIRQLPDESVSDIPIIAMTANAFDDDKQKAFDAGMNGHLSKPINIVKLFALLSEVVK